MLQSYTTCSDEFLSRQRLLVIAPHADDESFGCAGTMARLKNLGAEVFVVVVSVGDLHHYSDQEEYRFVTGSKRKEELSQVMQLLKVDDFDFLYEQSELHERLDTIPRRQLIELIESQGRLALDKVRPTMVAIPAISYNQDHEAVFRAAHTACRPGIPRRKAFQPIVLSYDNTALFWSLEREKFHPNFYVDISDFLDVKIQAVSLHKSQRRPSIHHSSPENVKHLAYARGKEISVDAAEGYMCHRFVL